MKNMKKFITLCGFLILGSIACGDADVVKAEAINEQTTDTSGYTITIPSDADLFEMSADIFIDESSPEESEVHLRASFIDSNGNWHGFSDSQSIYEHGKWFTVKKAFYGKVIDKSIFEVIVSGKSTKACIKNACLTKKELNIPIAN